MKTSGRVAPCGALLCFSHPGLKRILCGIASRRGRPGQQQQQQQQKLSVRVHATEDVPGPADADEGEELQVSGDWRAFQASLIKQQFSRADEEHYDGGEACKANRDLLWQQNRYLAQEGCWALPTETCERGCLLVAGPQAGSLMDARYDQLVILLLEHGPGGSAGIILNRPCNVLVENLLGWGWQPGGDSPSLEAAFSEERVYLGGFFPPGRLARQPITCLHGQADVAGSREVVPGIYVGGEEAAAQKVLSGVGGVSPRFFSGLMVWQPGQLQVELTSGVWYCATASRVLALKQCLQLPLPLWREVLHLMGGDYELVAAETP